MAVYEGECFRDTECSQSKRKAEVDVEAIAVEANGPKLKVSQARPVIFNSVENEYDELISGLDDQEPTTFMKGVSIKAFNALEKEHDKTFRFMRYNPKTEEVEVVDDGDLMQA